MHRKNKHLQVPLKGRNERATAAGVITVAGRVRFTCWGKRLTNREVTNSHRFCCSFSGAHLTVQCWAGTHTMEQGQLLQTPTPGSFSTEYPQTRTPGTGLCAKNKSCLHQPASSERQLQCSFYSLPPGAGTCSKEGWEYVIKGRQEGLQ